MRRARVHVAGTVAWKNVAAREKFAGGKQLLGEFLLDIPVKARRFETARSLIRLAEFLAFGRRSLLSSSPVRENLSSATLCRRLSTDLGALVFAYFFYN